MAAGDSARLLAVVEANTAQFEAAMRRIERLATQAFASAAQTSAQFQAAMNRSAVAANAAAAQFTRIQGTVGGLGTTLNTIGRAANQTATQLNRIQTTAGGLGTALANAGRGANALATQTTRAQTSLARLNNTMRQGTTTANAFGASTGRVGAFLGGALGVRALAEYADAWNRVGRALQSTQDIFGEVVVGQEELADAAVRTRSDFEALSILYIRMAQATRGLGFSQEELVKASQTVAIALKTGTATASEQRSVLTQLSQALIKGKLDGDEFRSVMENASVIQLALIRRLKTTKEELFNLSQKGLIQVNDLMQAILDSSEELERSFKNAPPTFSESVSNLITNLTRTVGEFDSAAGASQGFADVVATTGRELEFINSVIPATIQFLVNFTAAMNAAGNASNRGFRFLGRIAGVLAELAGMEPEFGAGGTIAENILEESQRTLSEYARNVELEIALQKKAEELREKRVKDLQGRTKDDVVAIKPPKIEEDTKEKALRGPDRRTLQEILDAQRQETEQIRLQTEVIGLNTLEQEKALKVQELINDAKEEGIAITPTVLAQIQAEANLYADAAAELERLGQVLDNVNDLVQEFGQQGIDAFVGLLDGTSSLNDSLVDTLKLLRNMILQAAILGKGPLSNIFGGATGGGLGELLTNIFGRIATGGSGFGGEAAPLIQGAFTGGAETTGSGAASSAPFTPFMAGRAQVPVIEIQIDENKMFASRVVQITGPVVVQGINQNNKALPGMLSDRQRRGI